MCARYTIKNGVMVTIPRFSVKPERAADPRTRASARFGVRLDELPRTRALVAEVLPRYGARFGVGLNESHFPPRYNPPPPEASARQARLCIKLRRGKPAFALSFGEASPPLH